MAIKVALLPTVEVMLLGDIKLLSEMGRRATLKFRPLSPPNARSMVRRLMAASTTRPPFPPVTSLVAFPTV